MYPANEAGWVALRKRKKTVAEQYAASGGIGRIATNGRDPDAVEFIECFFDE